MVSLHTCATELNRSLNGIATRLAEQFDGVAEQATMEGWVKQVSHVNDYFPLCVSHRAFAEAAGVGWRGQPGPVGGGKGAGWGKGGEFVGGAVFKKKKKMY